MEDMITLTLPTRWVVGLGLLGGLVLLSVFVGIALPPTTVFEPPFERVQARLGLGDLNPGLFLVFALLWFLLLGILTLGLFWLIFQVFWSGPPDPGVQSSVWDFRFLLVQLTALATVLGGVIALPLTMARLRLQRQGTQTADEALFNDKIAEAAADLHARRQRTMRGIDRSIDAWEDDIVRRNAAINRLEGLVEERMRAPVDDAAKRDVMIRVSRLLGTYAREISVEVKPKPTPDSLGYFELRKWVNALEPRSDIENAAQTLGRLRRYAGDLGSTVVVDLHRSNLQGCKLSGLDLNSANLEAAHLQGADLSTSLLQDAFLSSTELQFANLRGARLEGSNLRLAQLQGADLFLAQMQRSQLSAAQLQWADLRWTHLQEADLSFARLQGTYLYEVKLQGACLVMTLMQGAYLRAATMDENTDLAGVVLKGAAVRSVDSVTTERLQPFWKYIFSDGTVNVPDSKRPEHWVAHDLGPEFDREWHRVMREHFKMDPENPE